MTPTNLIFISLAYLATLFFFAYRLGKNSGFSQTKYAYALALCVYCTAWTFYGSVGRSAVTGFGYLGVYLGPTLVAPLMLLILTKAIKISKYLRISSIADFISSRYGKSQSIGALASIICILIVIPYISIQLKALNLSFQLLSSPSGQLDTGIFDHFYSDPGLYFGVVCALICIFFGTDKSAPTDRHPGIISVIAFESIFKLVAFLIGSGFIIYYINDGIGAIFNDYALSALSPELLDIRTLSDNGNSWFWICFISAMAFLILPRQFHMAVVENKEVDHVKFASAFVPLYMFAISILVVPIALEGKMAFFTTSTSPDNYLSSLLIDSDLIHIATIVFIGGLAASTGMIISSLISLSIMSSNHLLLPLLLGFKFTPLIRLENQLIYLRRILIMVILILSYTFYRGYAINYSLVSIGLISFVGISQLFPSFVLGLYWKYANYKGAITGMVVGAIIWAYTLPFANFCEIGIFSEDILTHGPFNISFLRPNALFGMEGYDPIAHASFWSLTTNFIVTCVVSLSTDRSPLEIAQSDIFLHPDKYIFENNTGVIAREANFVELKGVLNAILGPQKVNRILKQYKLDNGIETFEEYADELFIQYIENYLSGSLGAACTRVILENIVKNEPVKPEQLFNILDQTNQLYEYAKALEEKRDELKETTLQLGEANAKLKELDVLKNEFISNVTHELRTPLTSIRSLADSLNDYDLNTEEHDQVVKIIRTEAGRISLLINQVLDLRKMDSNYTIDVEKFDLSEAIQEVIDSLDDRTKRRQIIIDGEQVDIVSDRNKIKQVVLNLISNSLKFTDEDDLIRISLLRTDDVVLIQVIDHGIGIPKNDLDHIFDRFFQSKNHSRQMSQGSGLGLHITKNIVESLHGYIEVDSKIGQYTTFKVHLPDYIVNAPLRDADQTGENVVEISSVSSS